jgi:hypothetical protein
MPDFSRRDLIKTYALASSVPLTNNALAAGPVTPNQTDRSYWVSVLNRLASPVLHALSEGKLRLQMPVEAPHHNAADRSQYTHLEAFGRLLAGMAPWLESTDVDGAEAGLQGQYRDLALQSLSSAVDPSSPDFMNFNRGRQPVVDAAFLALAILRAPTELWSKLNTAAKKNLIKALLSSRVIQPAYNNWLLFSAMIEAFFCSVGEPWDRMRVDYAIRKHEEWYKGDGIYGDGSQFHFDYYNSFVIHPMLLEVMKTVSKQSKEWASLEPAIVARAQRYAVIQERLIGPDGSYPAIGRSITYRFGAFHLLADMALRKQLPRELKPEQVRGAMTAVIRRMIEAPGTFDQQGWLTVGFCGHQPWLGESYISTGSLYLCAIGLLPLGLSSRDPFWSAPPQPWTSQKIWSGKDIPADHAL